MRKKLHQDVFIGFGCEAFCLLVIWLNSSLPRNAKMMPNVLCWLMMALAVYIIYDGLKKSKLPEEEQGEKAFNKDAFKIPLITWGLVVLYFVLFYAVGYYIATGIMLIVLMRFMKATSWKTILLITTAYLLVIYFGFVRLLGVSVDGLGMLGNLL